MIRFGVLAPDSRASGGIFQYALLLLEVLEEEHAAGRIGAPVLVHGSPTELPVERLRGSGWTVEELPAFRSPYGGLLDSARALVGESGARRRWRRLRAQVEDAVRTPVDLDRRHPRPEVGAWLRSCGVDAMIYLYPTTLAFEAGVPFVFMIYDLQHRLQPEFPEVSADGEWEVREHVYRHATRNALVVVVDSEIGKEDVLDCYGAEGVRADAIDVLPLMPPPYMRGDDDEAEQLRVRRHYALPERYVFYPAQFWPHKNHERIVEALALLRDEGLHVDAVFAGSWSDDIRQRTHRRVSDRAAELGVADLVRIVGYVPDEDLVPLLAGAQALVMPTFFGPTNIPPLEAWVVGTPVITSDIRGIREHAGSAALLVDPRSPESIAAAIRTVWTEEGARARLREAGKARLQQFTHVDYQERVRSILVHAQTALAATGGVSST